MKRFNIPPPRSPNSIVPTPTNVSADVEVRSIGPSFQEEPPLYKGFTVKDKDLFYSPPSLQAEPIYVSQKVTFKAIKRNIDRDEYSVELTFDYLGNRKNLTVPREVCFTKRLLLKLQNEGLNVTEKSAAYLIMWFQNEERRLKLTAMQQFHQTIGFGMMGAAPIFKGYQAIGTESQYEGPLDLKPSGSEFEWHRLVQQYIIGHPERETILGVGLSSSIVGMLGLDSLFVHLSGNSTSGKTTMGKFAVSIWGNPSGKTEGLIRNWHATKNAIMGGLVGNNGCAVLLDEASMSGSEDFTEILYEVCGNKDKRRLTKDAEMKPVGSWNTVVFSTGEFSLFEKSKRNIGLKVRLLEFSNVDWTGSAVTADAIISCISQNYGFAGMVFAQKLMQLGKQAVQDGLTNMQRFTLDAMRERGVNDRFASRKAGKYALILYALKLSEEIFSFDIDFEGVCNFLCGFEKNEVEGRNILQTALEYFAACVTKNAGKLVSGKSTGCQSDFCGYEVWGKIHAFGEGFEVSILPDVFKKLMREGGFEDSMMLLKGWKANGIINAENDRLTRARKLFSDAPAVNVYVIRFKENPVCD